MACWKRYIQFSIVIGLMASLNIRIGFRKKLEKIGKQKNCELVCEWQRTIINHLYWCVSSSNDDGSELIKAKWLSLDNHIHNVHRKHSKEFPKCAHKRLRGKDRKRKWFKRRMFIHMHS